MQIMGIYVYSFSNVTNSDLALAIYEIKVEYVVFMSSKFSWFRGILPSCFNLFYVEQF